MSGLTIMDKFDSVCITTYAEKEVNYNLFESLWIPCSAKFVTLGATSTSNGVIQIYELNNGKVELIKEKKHDRSIKCGTFGASSLVNRHLATGDFCGNLDIWDIETSTSIYSVRAHQNVIFSVDGIAGRSLHCGAPEIVTGSYDGFVKVWDPRQKEKPVAIMEPLDEIKRQCWAVTFGNAYNSQERIVGAGYDNGDLKLFDLRNMALSDEFNLPDGICSLEFDRKDIKMNKLLATGLEDNISLFIMRNRSSYQYPTITERVHRSTVWCGKHLPQNRDIFMTCGGSGSLCLWK